MWNTWERLKLTCTPERRRAERRTRCLCSVSTATAQRTSRHVGSVPTQCIRHVGSKPPLKYSYLIRLKLTDYESFLYSDIFFVCLKVMNCHGVQTRSEHIKTSSSFRLITPDDHVMFRSSLHQFFIFFLLKYLFKTWYLYIKIRWI